MFQKIFENRIAFALLIAALVACHLLWEYFNGGVTSHNLLNREDLPAISNWWGLLTVPLISYFLLTLTQNRITNTAEPQTQTSAFQKAGWGLLGGLGFGLCLSLLWEVRLEEALSYLIYLPFLAALFIPVYRPEYFLGFGLGMVYTFGGVLPFLIGFVLVVVSFVIYKAIRGGVLWLIRKGSGGEP